MRRAWWLLPAVLIVAELSPMLFTGRSFDADWANHMWLVLVQHDAIAAHGHPSWFLHATGLGVFYPQFVFYGGTLYGSAGLLSFVLGVAGAYIAFFALGLAMGFGGWTWLARDLGVRGPLALVPGVVWVTAAYVMGNAYGRGAWPEFVATSAIPLVVAAAWALLRVRAITVAPAAALVGATVLLTGSHNITLVWGTVFLAALAVVVAVAAGPRAARALAPQRVAAVAGLLALGVGVNAWFLWPDLLYAGRAHLDVYDNGVGFYNTAAVVLNPIRRVPAESTAPGLTVQAPVLALGWALLALALARPWRDRRGGALLLRIAVGLCALLVAFLVLVLRDDPTVGPLGQAAWERMPTFLRYLQFAFRLETYVTALVCGLVLLAVVAVARMPAGRSRAALTGTIAAIGALSAYQAIHQVWRQPSFRDGRGFVAAAGPHRTPISWADAGNFRDRSAPVVAVPAGREAKLPPAAASDDAGGARVPAPPGTAPIRTNVGAGDYLVSLEGLVRVGRDRKGFVVARRPAAASGPVDLRVRPLATGPLRDGPLITLASLVGLALLAALGLRREWRGRRGPRAVAGRRGARRTARR